MTSEPYHRQGAGRAWWQPLSELFLVVVFWFVWNAGVFEVMRQTAHVKKVKELTETSHQAVTLIGLAGLLPAAFFAAHVSNRDWRTLLSVYRRIRWGLLARCLGIGLAISLTEVVLAVGAQLAAKGTAGFTAPDWGPFFGYCALVIVAVPFQAAGEEVMFRGVLQQLVGAYVRWLWLAISVSAIAFMFAHGGLQPASASILTMGIAYAWLANRTGGLEPGIAHHITNNVVALISVAAQHGLDHVGVQETNARVAWPSVAFAVAQIALYVWFVTRMQRRSAERALAAADQVEQHVLKRRSGVEHADDRRDAEPLPPEQQ